MYSFKMCTMSQPLNVKYLVTTSDRPKSDSHRNQNLIIGICEIIVGPMKFCLIFKKFYHLLLHRPGFKVH